MIVVVDYGMGNVRSVQKTFQRLNTEAVISGNPELILNASKIILPGVGHFKNAVENLRGRGLWEAIDEAVKEKKTPILGICLGMQLMTEHSEEGDAEGFGWIEGDTKKFNLNDPGLKIPHMGWNTIEQKKEHGIGASIEANSFFYFVHSYYVSCRNDQDILFTTNYGIPFVSGFQKGNVTGVQFHPEKSHKNGLKMIANFINQ
jgi:imidazole glycerol-phosphate synthase subunit HisH